MSALHHIDSLELASERLDCVRRETEQIVERWDKRLRFPLTKLGERYVNGQLSVHIHYGRPGGANDSHSSACAILHSVKPLATVADSSGKWLSHDINQFPVFVELVDNVNLQKRKVASVPSLVWLQTIDSCQRRDAGNALYFSTKSGMFNFAVGLPDALLGRLANRELDLGGESLPAFGCRELPNEMVEGASKVMHNLSGDHAHSGNGNTCASKHSLAQNVEIPSIFIGYDYVSVGAKAESDNWKRRKEFGHLAVELSDVLIGPF